MEKNDLIVIGAGIVGLATAYALGLRHPGERILVLEKESRVAAHQTGHNSGVLHSGIYYKPGSLKARNCREGKLAMETFCRHEGIPFDRCGKVIVAATHTEEKGLKALYERGRANGVDCEVIGVKKLREIEPHCRGVSAVLVRETGIVDYRAVCDRLCAKVMEKGGTVLFGHRCTGIQESGNEVVVETARGEFHASFLVNCAGLYCDKVAAMAGTKPPAKIIPFRGEYFIVAPERKGLCRNLIYPVPDPRFPFLGVHFTRMITGELECGPNAVFAFAREGYTKSAVNFGELAECLTYSGFIRMSLKYWRMGMHEMWRSVSKRAFVHALQRLIPEIQGADLSPAPAGVRAQAVSPDGGLVDDFAFCQTPRAVHVINAPSPAATASLSIGDFIAKKVGEM
jgi:L-2-hydroxyglutarate oxidase